MSKPKTEIPEELLVQFNAFPLKSGTGKVLWVNDSFRESLGTTDYKRFCFEASCILPIYDHDKVHLFMNEPHIRYADFYGGVGGAGNGGSGRCGLFEFLGDYYQVKGIGASPLVGKHGDFLYSHGGIPIDQGLQEVIYGMFCDTTIPNHDSGIVMLIELPNMFSPYDHPTIPDCKQTRVVVVRRFTPRMAHFLPNAEPAGLWERSSDLVRCTSGWQWVHNDDIDLEKSMYKFGMTIAMTKILRVMHGASIGGNITATGNLIDFGTFDVLPDYGKCITTRIGCNAWNEVNMIIGELCNQEAHITEMFSKNYELSDQFISGYGDGWANHGLLALGISTSGHFPNDKMVGMAMMRFLEQNSGVEYVIRKDQPSGIDFTKLIGNLAECITEKKNTRQMNKILKEVFPNTNDGNTIRTHLLMLYERYPEILVEGVNRYRVLEQVRWLIQRDKLNADIDNPTTIFSRIYLNMAALGHSFATI